jgi:phenylacetate-CoA ligase
MERDRWSKAQLMDYVMDQSRNLCKLAQAIPFYRDWALQTSTTRDFPILERAAAKQNSRQLLGQNTSSLMRVFTAGTTGSGMIVYWDRQGYLANWAYKMKHCLWAGVDPLEWRLTFFGARILAAERHQPPFWVKNYSDRQILVSIFHLGEENALAYANFLEQHQGLYLEGFPTVLYWVAKIVRALKGQLFFRAVFTTGEPLLPFMRTEIEQAFQTKAYDHYGMTEWAGLILECERGGYHALLDYGDLEIVDEQGKVQSPGQEGYLIWTGFINRAMPFIRYQVGDLGILEKEPCPCGKPYPLVKPTLTRDSDYLITPSGRVFSPRALSNQVFKNRVSFQSCQFVQEKSNEIIIHVVPDRMFDFQSDLDEVRKSLIEMVGTEMSVLEEIANEPLRRGSQGKIPLILSRIIRTEGITPNNWDEPLS